jgi:hypothetical protein
MTAVFEIRNVPEEVIIATGILLAFVIEINFHLQRALNGGRFKIQND